MNKPITFYKILFAPVILLLCSISLQSCTEEMPILTPPSGTISNISHIVLNINSKTYTIVNKTPGYVYFSNVTVGLGSNLYSQYSLSGSNGSATNPIDYFLTFGPDSTNTGNYTFNSSQLSFNNKTYSSINSSGTAKLTIDSLNTTTNTAGGSFSYYVYNSIYSPTDSIYVSGTFKIVE